MKTNISPSVIEEFYTKDKNNVLFWLAKTERYSQDRVYSNCIRVGTSEEVARKISREIDHFADSRVKMSDIRPLIFALLQKYDHEAARRFKAGEIYVRTSAQTFDRFDRSKIADSVVKETGLDEKNSDLIAFETEKFIKTMNIEYVSSSLIREIVNVKLIEHGFEKERNLYTRIGMPVYDLTQLIEKGSKENANLQYNPESLPYDETVLIRKNNSVKYERIGKIVDDIIDNNADKLILSENNRSEIVNGHFDVSIFSFDENFKVKESPVKAFIRNKPDNIYKITFSHGKSVRITKNHNLFLMKGGDTVSLPLSDLRIGDRILAPRRLEISESTEFIDGFSNLMKNSNNEQRKQILIFGKPIDRLIEENNLKSIDKFGVSCLNLNTLAEIGFKPSVEELKDISCRTLSSYETTFPAKLYYPLQGYIGSWLGLMLSEGHFGTTLFFTNTDQALHDKFAECSRKTFGEIPLRISKENNGCFNTIIASTSLAKIIPKIFDVLDESEEKQIPSYLMAAKNIVIKDFIKAYHDGDGQKNRMRITTSNKNIKESLIFLYLRLGEMTNIYENEFDNPNWNNAYDIELTNGKSSLLMANSLKIPVNVGQFSCGYEYMCADIVLDTICLLGNQVNQVSTNIHKFKRIGNYVTEKVLGRFIDSVKFILENNRTYNIIDMFGESEITYEQLGSILKLERNVVKEYTKRMISRNLMIKNGNKFKFTTATVENLKQIKRNMEKLKRIINSDFALVEIKQIEKISFENTYDLSVDTPTENFIAGEGCVFVHNTIHKIMADEVSKEYTLLKILPREVADAHLLGQIHVHDLDYFFSRPFCFSHDVRYFLKKGFRPDGTGEHTSIASPAKQPEVAFLHAAKVLAASQTNCFHPNENVVVEENGMIKNLTIEETVNKLKNGAELYSFGIEKWKIIKQPIIGFNEHIPNEDMLEIELENGKITKMLKSHPIFIFNHGKLEEKLAGGLSDNDFIPVPVSMINGNIIHELNFAEELLKLDKKLLKNIYLHDGNKKIKLIDYDGSLLSDSASLNFERSAVSLPAKIKITEEFMRILGYFSSEGHIAWYEDKDIYDIVLSFGSHESILVDDASRCIGKAFNLTVNKCQPKGRSFISLSFGGKLLALIFDKILKTGKFAVSKKIPEIIFNVDNILKTEFLKSYFYGDGHTHSKKEIIFDTVSRKMAADVSLLLLQLGIVSRIRKEICKERILENRKIKSTLRYRIEIAIDNIEEISNYIPQQIYKKMPIALAVPTNHAGMKNLYSEIKPSLSHLLRSSIMQKERTSRHKIKQFLEVLKEYPLDEHQKNNLNNTITFLDGDFGLLKIKKITVTEKPEKVYDLTTPTKSFIGGFGGILSHNCAGGQGFSYFNTYMAPAVVGCDEKRMKQLAQMFIYEMSQMYVARGGQSIHHDDFVWIKDDVISSVKIGEFIDSQINANKNRVVKKGGMEILRINNKSKTVSLNSETMKFEEHTITAVSRHKPASERIFKISTRSGKNVRVTDFHSVYTIRNGIPVKVRATELKAGDFVLTPKNASFEILDAKINLIEKLRKNAPREILNNIYVKVNKKKILIGDFNGKIDETTKIGFGLKKHATKSLEMPAILDIDEDIASLLGLFIGDGSTRKPKSKNVYIYLSIPSSEKLDRKIGKFVKKLCFKNMTRVNTVDLRFGASILKTVFLYALKTGRLCEERTVPPIIFSMPDKIVNAFLKGLYSSDGSIYIKNKSGTVGIEYSTVNEKLAHDLTFLLSSRLGIIPDITTRTPSINEIKGIKVNSCQLQYRLMINSYEQKVKFANDIGFLQENKNKLMNDMLKNEGLGIISRQHHTRRLPRDIVYAAFRESGAWVPDNIRTCRNIFEWALSQELEKISLNNTYDAPATLYKLLNSDIALDEIVNIETVPTSDYVYDFEVAPEGKHIENFLGGFGSILVSNTVFSSIDLDMHVPDTLKDVPVIGLRGSDAKGTYGDYEDETQKLFNAFLDVYMKGDAQGKPFNFPKFEVQLSPKDLNNGGKYDAEMYKLSELAAKFGTPYYMIKQPYMPEFSCYQCCAYLMPLDKSSDADDLVNGTVRGGSLQVVTLNLPQIAYESDKEERKLFELIDKRIDIAKQVMVIRRDIIERNLRNGMLPFLNQPIDAKGTRYYEPSKQSYTIGMVGINEMCKYCTGSEMHETVDSWMFGLKVMKHMKNKIAQLREETGMNFALARTPAESTATRFALIDRKRFPTKAIYQGDPDSKAIYYTNSFHVRPSADVPLFKRMQIEGAFHPLTDGGAMCLDYNEEIIVKENETTKIVKIGEFVENNLKNKKYLTDGAIYDNVINIKTVGLNSKNKINDAKILRVMKIPVSDNNIFEIKTKNNKKLKAVGGHKVFKLENGEIKEVFVNNLKNQDTLIMFKDVNVDEKNINDLTSELISNSDIVFNKDKSLWKLKRTKRFYPTEIKLDRNFGEMIGFMVSEGFKTVSEKTMANGNYVVGATFGLHEDYYADYFRELTERSFKNFLTKSRNYISREIAVQLSDKNLHYIFSNVLNIGLDANNRIIPDKVIFSNKSVLTGLLDAAFAGDGTIDNRQNKTQPIYNTTSKKLADDISFICSLCGYENSKTYVKRNDGREFYAVSLLRDSGKKFIDNSKLFRIKLPELAERKSTMNGFLLNHNATPFESLSKIYIKDIKIGKYINIHGDQMKKLLYLQHENNITASKIKSIIDNWIKILNRLGELDKIMNGNIFYRRKISADIGISESVVRKSVSMFRKYGKYKKNNYFSETTFNKIILKSGCYGAEIKDKIKQDIEKLKKFKNIVGSMGFDVVKNIEIMKSDSKYVYDIQTETSNFFTKEGILNHNSHIWLGDANPDPEAVMKLTKEIATKTAIQYTAFTKDLSICNSCGMTVGGINETCPSCKSKNVQIWSRITGYYQNINGWNKGKLQELKDRRRYGL